MGLEVEVMELCCPRVVGGTSLPRPCAIHQVLEVFKLLTVSTMIIVEYKQKQEQGQENPAKEYFVSFLQHERSRTFLNSMSMTMVPTVLK